MSKRSLWILASPGSAPTDVAGPFDVFAHACLQRRGGYRVRIVGARNRSVQTDRGFGIQASATLEEAAAAEGLPHTLLVAGGNPDMPEGSDESYAASWLREHAEGLKRIASVCTGAFVLGQAGLLDGRDATTHWMLLDALRARHPTARVADDGLYTCDGPIWTSAGLTSGMDLSLAMVEADCGHEEALAVARYLVLFLRRTGGQPQYSAVLAGQRAERRSLRELQAYIAENLSGDLSVEHLAAVARMSPRNLSRAFKKEMGISPGAFVRSVRIDEARRLLETTVLSMAEVVDRVGGGDESTLRRWFVRALGIPPRQYRERFRSRGS